MLCYLGVGERRYGDSPSAIHQRPYWEFQAVLEGKIQMLVEGESTEPSGKRLWLSAPGHRHGWTGQPGSIATVAVFHFLSIPELVKRRLRNMTSYSIPLSGIDCARLSKLAGTIAEAWRSPRPDMPLRHEHLLLELSLLVCGSDSPTISNRDSQRRERVNAALNWFHLNMRYNPSLDAVAKAVGASPAHLRRLFHEVMENSPKKIFDQLRFQRAIHLMTDQETKLESISLECGFQSASAFSRAFKCKFGCSPDSWRGRTAPH